jgi:hypothetical protein
MNTRMTVATTASMSAATSTPAMIFLFMGRHGSALA